MTRSLTLAFILAAGLATAAPWNKINPFKGKKQTPASQAKAGQSKPEQAKKSAPSKAAAKPEQASQQPSKKQQAKKEKVQKSKDYAGIYTTGTVAAIPKQTAGRLDLNDSEVLKFSYGKPTWSLSYRKVKTIEVADKKEDPLIRIPKVNERRRVFTLEYFDQNDELQFTTFEIPVKDSYEVLPLLEQRTGKGVAVAGAQRPGGWWGDSIWKTPRNTALWEEANPTQKTTTVAQKD